MGYDINLNGGFVIGYGFPDARWRRSPGPGRDSNSETPGPCPDDFDSVPGRDSGSARRGSAAGRRRIHWGSVTRTVKGHSVPGNGTIMMTVHWRQAAGGWRRRARGPGSGSPRLPLAVDPGARHLETHTRSQTPHFMSYPMDMTWILQHRVYFLAQCHIHVISMSYLFFKKDIFLAVDIPKFKKLHLVYTWYISSCHMPCLSMSYPCHKFARLSGAGSK